MKRFFLTSLILILVPTLLFLPLYCYLLYTSVVEAEDYSEVVEGKWDAFQYYYGNERVVCKDETYLSITFAGDTITVEGTVLPEYKGAFTWDGGTSLSYEVGGESYVYLLSFDTNNNLKIIVDDTPYIILLRKGGD